jgi:NAD(P)-dependent dehydrogenase (short-subunit alcohol dehydrogenase family)
MARFTDRVALITGGAQGIGRATAERLIADGARVVLADMDVALAERTAAELSRAGGQASAIACDIAEREQVRGAVAETLERQGRLDILVANAGIAAAQPFLDLDDGHWERVLAVNLTGTFYCVQEAGRAMAASGGGAIVVTASTNAFWMETNLAAYNTSKGGVVALVRSAAIDLAPFGIRVNAVEPCVVRTRLASFVTENPDEAAAYLDKIPLGRFAEARDVAHAIAFLASDEAAYITGQTLILDGGLTLGLKLNLPDEPLLKSAEAFGPP